MRLLSKLIRDRHPLLTMANTEGIPDEAVASLLSPTPWDGSITTNSASDVVARRKEALRQRMELSPGERPAARVVRSSRRPSTAIPVPKTKPTPQGEPEENENDLDQQDLPVPPMIGSIMERKVHRPSGKAPSKEPGKQSRFARQRNLPAPSTGGFPSVNVPLGTFVQPKPKKSVVAPLAKNDAASTSAGIQPSNNRTGSVNSLLQASSRDAQGMLAGMSSLEIQDSVHELKSALSPETVAFLRKRSAQRAAHKPSVSVTTETRAAAPKPSPAQPMMVPKSKEAKEIEKDQLAKVLTSIKTYDDLDAAYAAEMGDLGPELGNRSVSTDADDFALASNLLRSTVPRQNLWAARIVHRQLQKDWDERRECSVNGQDTPAWPYPIVLPVSLRCLLDASFMHVNGFVLHTYVLQSLYTLLRLRACVEHVVDVSGERETAASVYQEYFLDDAVATPPLDTCYPTATVQPLSVPEAPNVAYATSSTSSSAQNDGEAFAKDPMWTLLSKMRVLPRLTQLLQGKEVPSSLLPNEAIVAICGILAMLAQRSPGAASAIAQHPTLLSDLLERTLVPLDGMPHSGASVALSSVTLLCTLARQSRVAATSLDVELIIPRLLAMKATDATEFKLQQWTLILWRTLVRYGLCLTPLSTMLTLALPHMTLGPERPFSLSTEYFSAFANVLSCIRVVRRIDKDEKIAEEQRLLLSSASVWLSSTVRLAIRHLENMSVVESSDYSGELSKLRSTSGCLRFINMFIAVMEEAGDNSSGDFKSEDISGTEEIDCVVSLLALIESKDVQHALREIVPSSMNAALPTTLARPRNETNHVGESFTYEATLCALLESLLASVMALVDRVSGSRSRSVDEGAQNTEEHLTSLTAKLCDNLIENVQRFQAGGLPVSTPAANMQLARVRRDWFNRCHSAVFKFLANARLPDHHCIVQAIGCAVVGRLERGDEALAATLLSNDALFSSRFDATSQSLAAPLSTMLVREMCRSPPARNQLDHSFKLHNGLGITSDGLGPFDLQSLHSEAEGLGPTGESLELLLPMGNFWLWQILSGSVVHSETSFVNENAEREATQVLTSCLQIISDLEEQGGSSSWRLTYAGQLHRGVKLYHLMNLCFHPQSILGSKHITTPAMEMLDRYLYALTSQFETAYEFAEACLSHSSSKMRATETESTKLTQREERIAAQLLDAGEPTESTLSKEAFRSLEAFVSDLCVSYTTYGAQYPFYAKCLRTFLLPIFPDKIRCEILRSLRGMLQLFTLPDEDNSRLRRLLERSLLGGVYGTNRDSPMILDCVTETLCFEKDNAQFDQGYVPLFGVALLARSLAMSIAYNDASGVIASKRRLQSVPFTWTLRIVVTAEELLKTGDTASDVALVTLSSFMRAGDVSFSFQHSPNGLDDAAWKNAMSILKSQLNSRD